MDFRDESMFKPNLLEILYRIKEAIEENTEAIYTLIQEYKEDV